MACHQVLIFIFVNQILRIVNKMLFIYYLPSLIHYLLGFEESSKHAWLVGSLQEVRVSDFYL